MCGEIPTVGQPACKTGCDATTERRPWSCPYDRGMDTGDVVGLISGIAAIAAAGVAIWQALEARRARDEAKESSAEAAALAEKSNTAWQRIADAQEVVAQAHRPKAWGVPKQGSGDLWTIRNTSERAIVVERIEVKPTDAQPLLELEGSLPAQFRAGELLELFARSRYTLAIRSITIIWRFEQEPETHDSTRTLDARSTSRRR